MDTFADDKGYYQLAREILSHGKAFYDINIHLYAIVLGPGLPWINALTMLVFGQNWLGIFFVTSLASALVTLFTFKVALKVLNKPEALLAGLWSCFYLFYFIFAATSGKDIWMALFMILIIYFLIELFYKNKFSYPKFLLFIFIYVYSFHFDERFFMLAPFIFLYILISETSGFTKFKINKSVYFSFLVILLMIPWCIRNYEQHGKIVLISSRTERFTDKIFGYEPRQFGWTDIAGLYGYYYIHDYQIDSVLIGKKTITDGGCVISELQRQAMLNGQLPRPLKPIEAFWIRTKNLLRPFQIEGEYQVTGYCYYKQSFKHNVASFIFYGILFFFSFPGFYFLYKKDKNIFYLFFTTILIYTLIHSFFVPWTIWRYRLPLDSIFIIVGSCGIIQVYNRIKYNRLCDK
jgi:4-amino-4-deoxy-L-arabinose transferase-like glycosyltransferase